MSTRPSGHPGRIPSWKLRRWIPAILASGAGLTPMVWAQDPPSPPAQPPVAQPATPAQPPAATPTQAPVKTVSFMFEDKPWNQVLDWFAKESDLVLITTIKPTGSVTIKTDPGRKYTIPEVVDVLNEALAQQKYVLIRRSRSFSIWPADEKLDPSLVQRITLDEIKDKGDTEIVSVTVPLKTLNADDIVPYVQKLKGTFGEVNPFGSNSIILQDTAKNIRRIVHDLAALEDEKQAGDSLTYTCKFVRASLAAESLSKLLSDQTTQVQNAAMMQPPYGGYPYGGYPQQSDGRSSRDRSSSSTTGTGMAGRFKTVNIAVVEATNTIMITGPADKIAAATKFLKDLDQGQEGDKVRIIGPAEIRTYAVPAGSSETVAKTLTEVYKSSTVIRVTALPNRNEIMVYAPPADHFDIVRQLQGTKEVTSSTVTEVIPLASFKNPQEVVDQLKRLFPDTTGSGAILEPRTEPTPAVIVKGTQQQIADIKAALGAVEGVSGGIGGDDSRIRIVPIAGGNSAAAAEKLAELLRQMGNNPVELRGVEPRQPKPAPAPTPAPGSNFDSRRLPKTGPDYVVAQIADPQAKPPAPQPEAGKKPVVITVTGNSIVITSEDPVALNTVTQLARIITSDKPEDGLYEVIRLKNAPAEQAAQVINEIFNGPPPQAQAGGGGGGRGGRGGSQGGIGGALGFLTQFAGIGASAPSDPAAGRVRVVAEKQSNSLIVVKASQLDLFTIKRLLEKAIDNNEVESDVVMKSRIIPLQHAEATEVAAVLKDVFSNLTTASGGSGGSRGGRSGGGQFPFPFPIPGAQPGGGGTAQQPQLTIGTLQQTNSIVISCNEAVYKEVSALVKALDQDAETQTEIVKVVQIQGIDPVLIQQAIDAIAGRQPTTQQRGTGFGGTGGFGGSGFGGMGGFGGTGGFGTGGFGGSRGSGFVPGMGGGTRGGGSNRGGGGGSRGGGSNRRSSLDPGSGGRDFFEYRDMDVPSDNASLIFDPENPEHLAQYQPVAYQIPNIPNADALPQPGQQPNPLQPGQQPQPGQPGTIEAPAPSPETSVQALQELGLLILRARNPQEMEELLRFIDFIQKGTKAEIKLQLVELENGDATQIVNLLNTIYSRVNIQGATTTVIPGQGQAGGLGGLLRGFGGGQTAQAQSVGSVYFLALPRFNKILFAAPEARVEDVMDKIKLLDKPSSEQMKPARFPLKRASAQIVANQILNFFNNRYSPETAQTNQIRVTFDISSNTVIVQAGPADMKDIAEMIEALDNSTSNAVNELRVFKLNNAFADEIAQTLITAVTAGLSNPVPNPAYANLGTGLPQGLGGAGASPFATGGFGGAGVGGPGGGAGGVLGGAAGGIGGRGGAGGAFNTLNGGGLLTKTSSLRFYGSNGGPIESGFLEDVQIIPDNRINGVVVSAPEKTMRLLEKLIEELDTPSAARSDVKVFTLKRSDAQATLNLISQLFASTTGVGGGGLGGQFGGQAGGGVGPIGGNRPILTLTGAVAPGTTVVGLRASVDTRTNSLIVAGSPTDLETIRAIVARLEDAEAPQLISKVYKLRHAGSADVQTAVLTFLQNKLQAEQTQFTTTFQTFQRNVFIQAEPISNTLLIAASPEYFEEVIRLIEKVDAMPPQVFVQVLIAEVQLRNTEEFGVEVGLQSPVLFARSQVGTSPGTPGFNFNTTAALPNTNAADPGVVGFQGLGNLGVGRSGSTGVGGFVFSAGSEAFTLLIRALKSQGRVDVLSHPQLLLLDNQTGFFQVGQSFPIPTGLSQGVGQTLQGIEYREIGITLRVTPRINPDGKVLMRIEPQISNPSPALINLGNGQFATAFDQQTVQTTVLASDGETIVLGGLIRRSDSKNENKIPLLGDIPYLGAAFRYRTQAQERRELVFIVTPHLITSEADMRRITAEESRKMSWSLRDVAEVHSWGTPVLAGKTPEGMDPQYCPPGSPGSILPGYGGSMTPVNPGYPPATGILPGGIQPDGPTPIIPDGTIIPQQPGMSGQPLPFPQGSPMSNGYRHESLPAGIVPDRTTQPAVNATASPGIFGATPGQPATVAPAGWVPPPSAAPIVSQPAGQAPMNAPPPGWTYTGQPGPVQTPAATLRQHLANQQAEQQAKAEAEAKAKEQSTRTSNPGAKEAKKWNVFGR